MMEMLTLVILLAAAGLFAGLLGGLFGIGGGVVIVPALYTVFGILGVPEENRIKIAVGTSLASIIMTSYKSVSSHHKHGAVDWALLKNWAPFISLGAIIGAVIARFASPESLIWVFVIVIMGVAVQKLRPQVPTIEREGFPPVPLGLPKYIITLSIGILSSLMGIGGGVMGVIVLTHYQRSIHQAIATAAGFGFAIAVPGTLGFMVAGWGASGMPFGAIGFISIPAFMIIAAMTYITAPMGAKIAHGLPKQTLNRIFAIYLFITALLMLRDVLVG